MIETTKSYFNCGIEDFTRFTLSKNGKQIPENKIHKKITVKAEINHGRWIIKCPWCPSATFADPDDRKFFCTNCLNIEAEGQWIKVKFPKEINDIEFLLNARKEIKNKNWLPNETIEKLQAENIEHGLIYELPTT